MFCRITSFFVTAPVFSARNVPASVKIGISAFVTLSVYLIYGIDQTVPTDLSYVLLIIREILIGLLLGFVAYLLMTAVQTAGTFIDLQIGFGMANVYDPMTGASAPLTGNLKYAFAMLLFLTMNGHHYLLDAIVYSYRWVPLSNVFFLRLADGSIAEFLIQTLGQSFMLAFQMSAPIVVALFLTDVGLGFWPKLLLNLMYLQLGCRLSYSLVLLFCFCWFPVSPLYLVNCSKRYSDRWKNCLVPLDKGPAE